MPLGSPINFSLPPLTASDTNFIRILPSSWGRTEGQKASLDPIFISYREPLGSDFGLASSYSYVLSIHSFAGQNGVTSTSASYLQALVGVGSNWTSYGLGASNLVVGYLGKVGGRASINICRFETSPSQCPPVNAARASPANNPPPPPSRPPQVCPSAGLPIRPGEARTAPG